jgi:hypothetical protein
MVRFRFGNIFPDDPGWRFRIGNVLRASGEREGKMRADDLFWRTILLSEGLAGVGFLLGMVGAPAEVARAFGWASLGTVGLAGVALWAADREAFGWESRGWRALRYGALANALGISLVVLARLMR